MERHISEKDNEIKSLEKTVKCTKLEVSKLQKDLGKSKKQKENLLNEIFDRKKNADSLDTMNTELREEKRNLEATCNQLSEKLAMMTAKCQSLQSSTSALNPLAVPYTSQDTSHGNLTKTTATQHVVRPKVRTIIQDPIRTTNISTRETIAPADSRLKTSQNLPLSPPTLASKKNVTIIGASNMRNMSSRLQDKNTNAIVWTNPGCRMQDIENRASQMVSKSTDIAVIHLGTNNALSQESDADCLNNCCHALTKIMSSSKGCPLLVCSVPPTNYRQGQHRANMINTVFRDMCSTSPNMCYLDTGLATTDIAHDGIHLTNHGKDKLAKAIKNSIQDFLQTFIPRPSVSFSSSSEDDSPNCLPINTHESNGMTELKDAKKSFYFSYSCLR